MNRRSFLSTSSVLAGAAGLVPPARVFAVAKPSGFFGIHPFVDQHPEAVFIMRTHVDTKTNSEACRQAGLSFGRTVLVPMDATGTPVTRIISAKPNITEHTFVDTRRNFTLEDTMGITTDPFFVEGIFNTLMELGVPGKNLHCRDVNGNKMVEPRGYSAMGARTGATVATDRFTIATADDANDAAAFVWKDVPNGVVYERIPYLWPINGPNSWNLNIAKFKAHTMGVTLTGKNLQGTNAAPFQGYCRRWPAIDSMQKLEKTIGRQVIKSNVHEVVDAAFARHQKTIPRWDTPDLPATDPGYVAVNQNNTISMELWAHRTIDNHSASDFPLHVVEGIYGRDGDFNTGPNPYGSDDNKGPWKRPPSVDGRAWDYMTNIVIFGRTPWLVDIVGHWLGGHEPGNFGLFHIAMERGKLTMMNPMNIPVYEWVDGAAVRRPLTSFTRTPLRTSYLQQHHKGEPLWHLCNEPFDYSKVSEKKLTIPAKPTSRVLDQHIPSANTPQLAIEFSVPERGWVMVEILDQEGKSLETVTNAICDPGYHMAAWNTDKYPSGSYRYSVRFKDSHEVKGIELKKG
jgi:hypothetical protein